MYVCTIDDHIKCPRWYGIYEHHMIVVSVVDKSHLNVIHYTSSDGKGSFSSGSPANGKIVEGEVEINLKDKDDTVYLIIYDDGTAVRTGMEVVKEARRRLGEMEYNLLSKNCESFATWAVTNEEITQQGIKAKQGAKVGVATLVGVGVAVAAGKALYDAAVNKKNKEETKH